MPPFTSPRRLLLTVVWLVFVGPTLGSALRADPMSITLDSTGAGSWVTVSFNGASSSTFVGQFNMQIGNGPEFTAFCVDYPHNVSLGQTYLVNKSSSNGLTNGSEIAYLANTFGSTKLTNTQAAGLQLAIWYLLYDNGTTTGIFEYQNSDAISAAANTYLNDAANQSSTTILYDASPSGDGANRGQSVVLADPPPPPSSVPEPSMFLLFCLSLGVVGCYGLFHRMRSRSVVFHRMAQAR